ncbi:MAG: phosphate ABC transporter permease subunit PstC [Alphaproteobacteria bacterium]|nr:phosphate ABC transporter permease subunit PstC [Alphaproteobacteria bacterium]
MSHSVLFLVLAALTFGGFFMGRKRAVAQVDGAIRSLHSRPNYYGYLVALWCGIPAFALLLLWVGFESNVVNALLLASLPDSLTAGLDKSGLSLLLNDIHNLSAEVAPNRNIDDALMGAAAHYNDLQETGLLALAVVVLGVAIGGILVGGKLIHPDLRARVKVERAINRALFICSLLAIMITVGIVMSLLFETIRFFGKVSPFDFLFGLEWSPQTAIRADQVGSSGAFGALPLLAGTMLISLIAMCVAAPIGLLSAIYLVEYAPRKMRAVVKPLLEILAGIPTVVYGFFAALTAAPFIRDVGTSMGLSVSSESALAAGVVMGIMIIPFVSSLSDDVINAVPQSMRDGSYGLGATQSETILRVVLPAALPGIVGSMLLAVSRAIGETMIVVMAAGLAANLTVNPLEAVTTVTVQIVTLLVGDQEFDSAKTLAAFALGLLLFCITLALNVVALMIVNRYREQYE